MKTDVLLSLLFVSILNCSFFLPKMVGAESQKPKLKSHKSNVKKPKTPCLKKQVCMIRKYHNHILQINPWYREPREEPFNTNSYKKSGRQSKVTTSKYGI